MRLGRALIAKVVVAFSTFTSAWPRTAERYLAAGALMGVVGGLGWYLIYVLLRFAFSLGSNSFLSRGGSIAVFLVTMSVAARASGDEKSMDEAQEWFRCLPPKSQTFVTIGVPVLPCLLFALVALSSRLLPH